MLSSFRLFLDDTYMYDDAARGSIRPHHMGHWYDEPPYESDPDDFLMSHINSGPAAIIQVHKFLFSYLLLMIEQIYTLHIDCSYFIHTVIFGVSFQWNIHIQFCRAIYCGTSTSVCIHLKLVWSKIKLKLNWTWNSSVIIGIIIPLMFEFHCKI